MSLGDVYNDMADEVVELVAAIETLADARETAGLEADPAKAVQLNAQASRMIHMHQTSLLAMISRQLLWIQRAMLEQLPTDDEDSGR